MEAFEPGPAWCSNGTFDRSGSYDDNDTRRTEVVYTARFWMLPRHLIDWSMQVSFSNCFVVTFLSSS